MRRLRGGRPSWRVFAPEGLSTRAPTHVRLAAGALDTALHDLADLLARRFVHVDPADRDAVFRAFARDQTIDVR
jgi:hypothetical protein